jgi:hypothetical protein
MGVRLNAEGPRMKFFWTIVLAALLIAACQPDTSGLPQELPTLAVLASLTPTLDVDVPTAEPTAVPDTNTPPPTETIPRPTDVPQPTNTPRPTATPIDPTQAAAVALTAAVDLAPRIITLTPNANAVVGTAQVLADVIITESQFQQAMNAAIAEISNIQQAYVDFQPDGIYVDLTALGGQAYIAGRVQVLIQLSGGFATISIGEVTTNALEPPEGYLVTVNGEFFGMMVSVLDEILNQRVGPENDLQDLILTDSTLEVLLLIPET